jgi:hypothetical protein
MAVPFVRSAPFVVPELFKAADISRYDNHHKDGLADQQAKQMMGTANPMTGASNRAGGSTQCPTCNRWHRPGSMCTKSLPTGMITKGRRVAVYHGMEPGNAFRDPGSGAYADAPQSGNAAADVAMEGLKRVVTSHNDSHPESYMPPQPPVTEPQMEPVTEPQLEPNLGWADTGSVSQPAPPPPVPTPIRGIHNLLTYKPDPTKPQDGAKKLADNSLQLQTQQANYLTALRNWQAQYGTGGAY